MPVPILPPRGPRKARLWSGEKVLDRVSAGRAVSDGKLILFHRVNDEETVTCLDARTGDPKWTKSYPSTYRDDFGFDGRPARDAVHRQGTIYTFGRKAC